MQTIQQNDIIRLNGQWIHIENTPSLLEIIPGLANRFSVQKLFNMFIYQIQAQRLRSLEIPIAESIAGIVMQPQKIIVQIQCFKPESVFFEPFSQLIGCCCFPG